MYASPVDAPAGTLAKDVTRYDIASARQVKDTMIELGLTKLEVAMIEFASKNLEELRRLSTKPEKREDYRKRIMQYACVAEDVLSACEVRKQSRIYQAEQAVKQQEQADADALKAKEATLEGEDVAGKIEPEGDDGQDADPSEDGPSVIIDPSAE
jgi:hypothetical protein